MTAPVKANRLVRNALRARAGVGVLAFLSARPAVAQPEPHATAHFAEALRAGDSAWTAGGHAEARSAYARVLALDSAGSSRAVYRLAVMYTWDGNLRGAIPLFSLYVRP